MYFAAQVCQINCSEGGVPKYAVHEVAVTKQGFEGDEQADKEHHGGRDKAVCIYSFDLILALQAEGHPIFAGSTGENLTLAGLDWRDVVPGAQFSVGNEVLLEITAYASPCQTIARSFMDGNFNRISSKTNPGWARAYAKVLKSGQIRVGDTVQSHQPETLNIYVANS